MPTRVLGSVTIAPDDALRFSIGLTQAAQTHRALGPFEFKLIMDGKHAVVRLFDSKKDVIFERDLGTITT